MEHSFAVGWSLEEFHKALLWALLLVGGLVLTYTLQKRRERSLPTLSDDDFVAEMRSTIPQMREVNVSQVISVRMEVANLLHIDSRLLRPGDNLNALVNRVDLFGAVRVGLGDLIDHVATIQADYGQPEEWEFDTVGELVEYLSLHPDLKVPPSESDESSARPR